MVVEYSPTILPQNGKGDFRVAGTWKVLTCIEMEKKCEQSQNGAFRGVSGEETLLGKNMTLLRHAVSRAALDEIERAFKLVKE